ncbi:MAG: hypothetical protein WAM17_10010 [Rhodoplanes sp.]
MRKFGEALDLDAGLAEEGRKIRRERVREVERGAKANLFGLRQAWHGRERRGAGRNEARPAEEAAPREPSVDDVHATGNAHHRLLSSYPALPRPDATFELLPPAGVKRDPRRTISVIPNY